jgi:acyl dehydratase
VTIADSDPRPWSVRAANLAEHAINPIHTDIGAQAAGFPRALVAGVTTYAYLTHPLAVAWGEDWVGGGGAIVTFRSPVFLDDELVCDPNHTPHGWSVSAVVAGQTRADALAIIDAGPPPVARAGEALRPRRIRLEGEFGAEYGSRAGDDLDLYQRCGIVHPAVWPALANHLVHTEVARGSWIHTRSTIRHHQAVPIGSTADLRGVVVNRRESRAGERAVLDVTIEVDGVVVATLEHEAIVALPGAARHSPSAHTPASDE